VGDGANHARESPKSKRGNRADTQAAAAGYIFFPLGPALGF
jgi:hypothetical protein